MPVGDGKAVVAGGMVYVSSIGPVDPETGAVVARRRSSEQTRRCMTNLKARLEGAGSSLDNVVWANWSLQDPSDFDEFNEEWNRWFPGDAPLGQLTHDAAAPAAGRLRRLARRHRHDLSVPARRQVRPGCPGPPSPTRGPSRAGPCGG